MESQAARTGKHLLRGSASRLWAPRGPATRDECPEVPDTGQKKNLDKKDGRRMSFQKPKGTIEYTVESRDSLNSIALKFDTTPNELVQLNKLFCRSVVTGQVLYVPDPEYVSSAESSPSLSPVSPLSPTSSEAEFDKTANPDAVHPKEATPASVITRPTRVVSSTSEEEEAFTEKFLKINCKYITSGKKALLLECRINCGLFDPDCGALRKVIQTPEENTCSVGVEHLTDGSKVNLGAVVFCTSTLILYFFGIKVHTGLLGLHPDVLGMSSLVGGGCAYANVQRKGRSLLPPGTVSGVLLVTPNNIMFDPHKTDPLVQENGCEEYGIMCPMEEVMSAAMYRDILDREIKESLPAEINLLSGKDFCHSKKITGMNTEEIDWRTCDAGNDSASTAPRSTEESLSEEVFTESELSPIREEHVSSDKSSEASSESVQTVSHTGVGGLTAQAESSSPPAHLKVNTEHSTKGTGTMSQEADLSHGEMATQDGDQVTDKFQEASGPVDASPGVKGHADQSPCPQESALQQDGGGKENVPYGETTEFKQKQAVNKDQEGKEQRQDSEVEELRKLWKTHTMQQTKQHRENIQQVSQKDIKHKIASADGHVEGFALLKEKKRHRLHKFLCLRVGKPMRKTFVSQASATMQQYAQRDKKHEYWFAVPQERTDHLYAFFIQWSPEIYAEDTGEYTREPGFIVVKKIEESEANEDPTSEVAAREWEITTREDISSKQAAPVRAELEAESFRPNLSDPSELLLPDQIEKLTRHLPPRTIGYPWTLVYGTGKHGTSLKTLYRTMTGLDTPVLLVIKDSDGQVFGALASEPFKVSDGFYGTGETFVFTFCPEFEVFKWTGDNMFFIKGDMDSLAFGGGGGEFALWLDGDLYHGRSHSCKTFGNHTLSKKEDFFIQDIEIWAFE